MARSPAHDIAADLRASLAEHGAQIERVAGIAEAISRTAAELKSSRPTLPSAEAQPDEPSAPPSTPQD